MRALSLAKQICLTFLFCLGFWSAHASPDPSIKWQVIETPHFQVIFDSRHYQLAIRYAEASEQAYSATLGFYNERPTKTVVVIDDSTDLANGFAMGLPYPLISAFPVLPPPMESIADFGNWEQELMMHEYVHILQFEPANGLAKPLRWVFGTILRPNMLLPRWYMEGQAVFMETRLSHRGRLRSQSAMALPRALVESGKLREETIGRLGEISIPDWVGGQRPYLLGGLLWAEIARTGGEEVIGGLNYDYSKRVPYIINTPITRRTGFDYAGLLSKTYSRLETKIAEQIKTIDANGRYPAEDLALQIGFMNHSPEISPDGAKLIYVARTHNTDSRIELIERAAGEAQSFRAGKRRSLLTGTGIQRASWLPDSSAVIYDKIDAYDRYYQFSDLFRYEFASKKSKRLTKGLRAREAVVSPDGKYIAFIQGLPGSSRLAQVDVTGENLKSLYESPRVGVRLSQPEFLSDKELIFVEKSQDGLDDFQVLDLTNGKVRSVLTDFRPVAYPRLTTEGLTFVSGKSGIDNIYLADAELKIARPITNVTTRALTAELDTATGELLFARLTSDGQRIHATPKTAWQEPTLAAPQIEPLVDYPFEQYKLDAPVEFDREPKPYRALPYMRPRYWLPFAYIIPDGAYFSASTSASDPLNKHIYALQGAFDTLSKKPSFAAQYTNEQTRVSYSIYGADTNEYIYSGDFTRHNLIALGRASFFLARGSTKWKGVFGWEYLATQLDADISSDHETRTGPQVSLSYADVSQRGLEISPEKGGTAVLSHTTYLPDLGDLAYDKTDLLTSYYFSKFLPTRHAIALFVNATYAPRLRNVLLGQTTSASDYTSPLLSNEFIMRGYPNSAFIGRTLINTNLEYRFPISYKYKGFGTMPFFLNRIHGAVFGDTINVDGGAYDREDNIYRRVRTNHAYVGYGAELRFDVTAFYYIPMRLLVGAYYGADPRSGYGLTPFLGITL